MQPIEPLIRPLVDALNDTGLMETFSSCQGHFGEDHDPDNINDRTKANVRAYFLPDVPEDKVEHLICWVLSDHMDDPVKWDARLTVAKEYIADPRENGVLQPLDAILVFELSPFDRTVSDPTKRNVVNKLIERTTASVREYIKQQATKP
jgi:hypothetical protein